MSMITAKRRILLVDDDPVSRIAMAGMCRRLGTPVEMAIDGLEAVEAAGNRHFDLVLLDLQLPGLDGFETARRLRQISRDPRIVAITATIVDETTQLCLKAGIDSVMLKPPTMDALIEHLGAGL